MYCPYACPAGQVGLQWDPKATSYTYPISQNGGLYCNEDGEIEKPFPKKDYCTNGVGTALVNNTCGGVVSFCQTVLPGNEAMLIPTEVQAGMSEIIAVPDPSYWVSTAAHYYINAPGVGIEEGCVWGTKENPVGNWSPYVAGANADASGNTYVKIGWNPVYLESDCPFKTTLPNFGVRMVCEGTCVGLPCEINPKFNGVNEVTSSLAADGAGGGAFCVGTAQPGSRMYLEVFEVDGTSNSGGSSSSQSQQEDTLASFDDSSSNNEESAQKSSSSSETPTPESTSSSVAPTSSSEPTTSSELSTSSSEPSTSSAVVETTSSPEPTSSDVSTSSSVEPSSSSVVISSSSAEPSSSSVVISSSSIEPSTSSAVISSSSIEPSTSSAVPSTSSVESSTSSDISTSSSVESSTSTAVSSTSSIEPSTSSVEPSTSSVASSTSSAMSSTSSVESSTSSAASSSSSTVSSTSSAESTPSSTKITTSSKVTTSSKPTTSSSALTTNSTRSSSSSHAKTTSSSAKPSTTSKIIQFTSKNSTVSQTHQSTSSNITVSRTAQNLKALEATVTSEGLTTYDVKSVSSLLSESRSVLYNLADSQNSATMFSQATETPAVVSTGIETISKSNSNAAVAPMAHFVGFISVVAAALVL